MVYADIELINAIDLVLSKRHIIGEKEVKRMRINILVDSGAYMMAINDTSRHNLIFRL